MNNKVARKLLTLFALLLVTVSCSGGNQPKTNGNMEKNGKTLILFFSHAGENYSVGNIKVGNTRLVAEEIQKITGGDLFEIVPEKSYDMPYNDLTKLAKQELENGDKPAYKGDVDDMSQYSTVYIGGPVWWGTYPQVMFTFFDNHDLNGKTILPFTTHEGSGLGSVVGDLKKLYPKANFKQAFSIYGHEVRKESMKAKVSTWIHEANND